MYKKAVSYLSLIIILALSIFSATAQTRREPRKPAAATADAPQLAPRDMLDRARAATSQRERIDLLEKLVANQRDPQVAGEARDLLMREYALRGEQYLREGSPQLASQDFRSVFRLAPQTMTDRVFGQFIFPMPIAMNAFGYRTESVELMRSFESRFEADPNRLVQIGFFYVQIEAPTEAVRVLERAVQLAPDDHRAHNSLGTAYLISLRLDEAATEFERALQLNPRDEYANLNLANLARGMGNNERAVSYYRKQLEVKPDEAEALGGMAISQLALGRDEEAEASIKRAAQLAPEDYRFLTQLAYFYITRRKPALARPLVERAARIDQRYVWAHITKANIDAFEGKFGDALSTVINAQTLGTFPTLGFELVKALMSLDGYDQAIEIFGKSFKVTESGEFETMLGGVVKARSPKLDLLLQRERQASLFLNDHPTTALQYRLAEALARIEHYSRMARAGRRPDVAAGRRRAGSQAAGRRQPARKEDDLTTATRPRRVDAAEQMQGTADLKLAAGRDSGLPGMEELLRAITTFTTLDDGRQAFRMVWVSRKLTDTGIALEAAEQLARRAIALADPATQPGGSMRDAPLLDREGRRAVFLGRAQDALGWALLKKGETRAAVASLARAVEVYPPSAERKSALWHLAVAVEESGDEKRALDLYIASYDPATTVSSVRRAQIESLYKKLNGSLAGLEQKLKSQ